jgi:hypothetical protein
VPLALAEGIMAISRVERQRLRAGLQIALVTVCALQFLALSSITLPITPADRLHSTGLDAKNEVFADSVGWDSISAQVLKAYQDLPAAERSQTVVISRYYGVPGALDVYVTPALRPPAFSPQLSDWYWLPGDLTATQALMVDYLPSDVTWMCSSAQLVTHISVPYGVQGLEQGAPITSCRLTEPIPAVWGRLREFS